MLAAHGEKIGVATNNVAEYSALIAGLEKALELGVDEVEVVSDSELMVKQMLGEYRVKNEALQELWLARGRLARPARQGRLHRGAPRAQRAGRPARQRGPRRALGPSAAAILPPLADVAQLARASPCHGEGRGFESHHPLYKAPGNGGFFRCLGRDDRSARNRQRLVAAHCCPIKRPVEGPADGGSISSGSRPRLRVHVQREADVLVAEQVGGLLMRLVAVAPQARE